MPSNGGLASKRVHQLVLMQALGISRTALEHALITFSLTPFSFEILDFINIINHVKLINLDCQLLLNIVVEQNENTLYINR